MIGVLAGGVGAARFLRGLVREIPETQLRVVVNTGDDTVMHGLHISPDIDTVVYTLGEVIDPIRQWGLEDESWNTLDALRRYEASRPPASAAASTWFGLGDRDIATHLYRTTRLEEGALLTTITREIASAWNVGVDVAPMTDDRVATMVDVEMEGEPTRLSFQEYFVRHRHSIPVTGLEFAGADRARATCLPTLTDVDSIILAPSNPLVSIGPIRALQGVDELLMRRRNDVIAISPIVAGSAIKGPADRMMAELGFEPSVVGIARLYSPICGTLVIDDRDSDKQAAVERLGMRCIVTDTIMNDIDVTRRLARVVLDAGV